MGGAAVGGLGVVVGAGMAGDGWEVREPSSRTLFRREVEAEVGGDRWGRGAGGREGGSLSQSGSSGCTN
jgi:hypothetical protein